MNEQLLGDFFCGTLDCILGKKGVNAYLKLLRNATCSLEMQPCIFKLSIFSSKLLMKSFKCH